VFAKIGIKHIVRQATKRMAASRCTSAMSALPQKEIKHEKAGDAYIIGMGGRSISSKGSSKPE